MLKASMKRNLGTFLVTAPDNSTVLFTSSILRSKMKLVSLNALNKLVDVIDFVVRRNFITIDKHK